MKRFCYLIRNLGRSTNYLKERTRSLTFKKMMNILKVEWALVRRNAFVNAYPYEIIIDPTSVCQLRCPLCSTGANLSTKKKGFMEFSTFKKIMDEVGSYAVHVYLHNWGESLLHKDIVRFIKYAKRFNVAVSISTNLSFNIAQEDVDKLITSGLDTLVVSIDGVTRETYEKYRVGGDFDLVMTNLRFLVERRRKLGSKRPYLEWQFLRMKHNVNEVEKARDMAREIGIDSLAFGIAILPFGINDSEMAREWLPEDDLKKRIRYDMQDSDVLRRQCWWLWRAAVFNWDGTISPCCYVNEESATFGNILEDTFKNIWNNNAYLSARRLFSKETGTEKIVCRKCGMFSSS